MIYFFSFGLVSVHPLSVSSFYSKDSLVALCWEREAILAFSLYLFTLCHLVYAVFPLVSGAGHGIRLYRFLIIGFCLHFTVRGYLFVCVGVLQPSQQ